MNAEHWVLERLRDWLHRHKQEQRRSDLRLLALFVTCMLAVQMSFAQDIPGTNVVDSVEAKYSKVTVMEADFTQTIKSQLGEDNKRGKVTIKRPAMMHWSFSEGAQLFVTNGERMWIYNKLDNQVIQYDDVSKTRSTSDSLLQSLDDLQSLFTITVKPEQNGDFVLDMAPKGEATSFKQLLLTVNKEYVVKQLVITDAFDTVTKMQFNNVKLNGSVQDSIFEFTAPDGASVINAGGL